MHGFDEGSPATADDLNDTRPWYKLLTRYHWFVLIVAALGWLFDCLDQQLFTLARPKAMQELLEVAPDSPLIGLWGGYATSIFIIGWATGGLIFGALGDRIGRAKTMLITIVMYSLCTGLSSLSVSVWDFSLYRFLTGLGVGGEFAVGVALVAEVMPARARPRALSLLQALSAIGNVSAALIGLALAPLEEQGISAWRVMFIIGALPALLALVIRRRLKEPEQWQKVAQSGGAVVKRGSYSEMFGDPRWRRNAIIGLMLAVPGVIGLWGIGFFSGDLSRQVFRKNLAPDVYTEYFKRVSGNPEQTAVLQRFLDWELKPPPPDERKKILAGLPQDQQELRKQVEQTISKELTIWQSLTLLMQQVGAFLGMYSFGWITVRIGRRPTFLIAFLGAAASTAFVFAYLNKPTDIFWMIPMMGFFQLSLFAGYAIYFPELFPTRLRSTGTSFCYNVGRFVAAGGPTVLGLLTSRVFDPANYPPPLNWRYAGVSMCAIFLVGIVTLWFAPETKDTALPE
jgi:MFS family permease